MPPSSPLPTFVYKILPDAPPNPFQGIMPSDLDARDGFIHLSTAEQVPSTADRFYSTAQTLWFLKIPLKTIENKTRWEDNPSGCFPHFYSTSIGHDQVESMKKFEMVNALAWSTILKSDGWLV
ncbi:hypothetical protein MMC21_008025 [Puttea exsequens]|nr:hypothetical protein [Puttea exsequens]